jgi:ABC-2 type transport system ATP-binding protein
MERLLGAAGLTPFRRRAAGDLSGGMKQKLGLACALVHTPRVLLLDEPTNGVDPVSRRDFWRILYGLQKEGVTLLVSTAYLDEAERCDRVGLMHRGRMVACGTPAALKAKMPGSLLEVSTAESRRAAAALREAWPSWTVGLFGDRVHAAVPEAVAGREAVETALRARGVSWESVRSIPPSLEDLFLALLRQETA